ncbi:hypothetical protein [Arthrobacter sp. KK5.5]|uniref:hypothetical protein n=1 Tax=Arthrobacter sp. KK5.5 TaxID=3373084 RepID=UPI003EE70592
MTAAPMRHAGPPAWFRSADCRLFDFEAVLAERTVPYPHADAVESEVLIYGG